MKWFAFVIIVAALAGGCASELDKLPQYSLRPAADGMEIVAARADAIKTVSAPGLMTLRRPDGASVRFDIAFVRDNSGSMRLRAWKLGRAVFDLTINPSGVWLLTPDDDALKKKVETAGVSARQLAETWNLFNQGELYRSPDRTIQRLGQTWILEVPRDQTTICAAINIGALVPLRYWLRDDQRNTRFDLKLSDYKLIDKLAFAHRYIATSDQGEIEISLHDVELNQSLAAGAFIPPQRAAKFP